VALEGGKIECVVTLDGDGREPKQHPGGKEWDFWFEEVGRVRFLHSQNRTKFALAGRAGCEAATYKLNRVRIDGWPLGSHVCVLTALGRYAELTFANATSFSFQYVLRE
jgi:hypothetical protein